MCLVVGVVVAGGAVVGDGAIAVIDVCDACETCTYTYTRDLLRFM